MMGPIHQSFSLAILAATLIGCAPQRLVGVTSYLSRAIQFPTSSDTAGIGVLVAANPDQPMLEAEVGRKVELLVSARGFKVGEPNAAEHILFIYLTMDEGKTHTGVMPVREGGGMAYSNVRTSSGQTATIMTQMPEQTSYVPYDYTVYTAFSGIELIDKKRWDVLSEKRKSDATVWRCELTSPSDTSDLRVAIDFMLIAAMDRFGTDTGKRIEVTLKESDPRVIDLRARASPVPATR